MRTDREKIENLKRARRRQLPQIVALEDKGDQKAARDKLNGIVGYACARNANHLLEIALAEITVEMREQLRALT